MSFPFTWVSTWTRQAYATFPTACWEVQPCQAPAVTGLRQGEIAVCALVFAGASAQGEGEAASGMHDPRLVRLAVEDTLSVEDGLHSMRVPGAQTAGDGAERVLVS